MITDHLFFKIQHVERVPLGLALAGVNDSWNKLTLAEIEAEIGKEVSVHSPEGQVLNYNVIDVTTNTSIVGRRNIFILIPEFGIPSLVGSRVYRKL